MKPTFTESFLNDVKEANDLIDVAGDYFNLKKFGEVYRAHCIHPGGDKTPSLTFFPDTKSFYCFSCHAGTKDGETKGSDVISFVQWLENLEWQDAVLFLADRVNIPHPSEKMTQEDRDRQVLYDKILADNRQYWTNLETKEGQEIKEWFYSRGMNESDIAKWRLGAHKYVDEETRLVPSYAIMDEQGRTVSFSHRLGLEGAKYKNGHTNSIFKKSSILYGLNFIKKDIRKKGHIVLVEGYNDAIILQKYGVPAAAIMSTSISTGQISLIKRFADKVILFLDGDKAGIDSTLSNTKALREEDIDVEILNVKGYDPDEICLKQKENMEDYILENKRLAFNFMTTNILDKYFDESMRLKTEALKKLSEVLSYIDNEAEKTLYKERITKILSQDKEK